MTKPFKYFLAAVLSGFLAAVCFSLIIDHTHSWLTPFAIFFVLLSTLLLFAVTVVGGRHD